MMPKRRVQTLAWWLRRPRLYPEFARLQLVKLFGGVDGGPQERRRALDWCRQRALETGEALERLTGSRPSATVEQCFPDVFRRAVERAELCRVEMGGAGNIDLLYRLAEHLEARRVLETGVAYGWSSLAILLSLQGREGSRLVSTDRPYPRFGEEASVGCVVPAELRVGWTIIDRADRQALPRALRLLGAVDLCHYDSDKSRSGRSWAYPLLWHALRPGGVFVSDDIQDNLAFREFAEGIGVEPLVVSWKEQYVGVLCKRGG